MHIDVSIIRLESDKENQASDTLADTFIDDPLYKHIFADFNVRSLTLRRLFSAVVGYSLKYGQEYATASVEGSRVGYRQETQR